MCNYLFVFFTIGFVTIKPVEPIKPRTEGRNGSIFGLVLKPLLDSNAYVICMVCVTSFKRPIGEKYLYAHNSSKINCLVTTIILNYLDKHRWKRIERK